MNDHFSDSQLQDRSDALTRFYAAWRQLRRGPAEKKIARWARSSLDQELNMSEIDVLVELSRHAGGRSIGQLAVGLLADQGNTSATVTRLQKAGHVTRDTGIDGRVTLVRPTPSGLAVIQNVLKRRVEMFDAAFFDWPDHRLNEFLSDMELVIDRIVSCIEPSSAK